MANFTVLSFTVIASVCFTGTKYKQKNSFEMTLIGDKSKYLYDTVITLFEICAFIALYSW